MIKLFRNIRQSLIAEGKTTKYLKYALGEIILVVIGILIALSINNWNENRKDHQEEVKLLRQLKVDLTENQDEIKILIKRLQVNSSAMDSVIIYFKEHVYNSRIPIYVALIHRKTFFNNSNSGYKLIGNGKYKLISNDTLLNGILQLYEKDFVNILSRQELMNDKIEYKLYPLTNKFFMVKNDISIRLDDLDVVASEIYSPIDYPTLSKNNEYINNLHQLDKTFKIRLSYLEITKEKLSKILKILDLELDKMN